MLVFAASKILLINLLASKLRSNLEVDSRVKFKEEVFKISSSRNSFQSAFLVLNLKVLDLVLELGSSLFQIVKRILKWSEPRSSKTC